MAGLTREYDSLLSNLKLEGWQLVSDDTGTATATAVSVDMAHLEEVLAVVQITGSYAADITLVELVASDNATPGAGNVAVIRSVAYSAGHPDAIGDQVCITATAEEVNEVGVRDYSSTPVDRATQFNMRYVYLRVTSAAANTYLVAYIGKPTWRYKDLTPAATIA